MELRTKKQKIDAGKLLFSNHDLKVLLIPLMVEQLLNSLMGTLEVQLFLLFLWWIPLMCWSFRCSPH